MKALAGCIVIALATMGSTAFAAGTAASASAVTAAPPVSETTARALTVAPLAAGQQPGASATQPAATPSYPPLPQEKAGKPFRNGGPGSKSMDLRRCLNLKDNAAIAKCAGEL